MRLSKTKRAELLNQYGFILRRQKEADRGDDEQEKDLKQGWREGAEMILRGIGFTDQELQEYRNEVFAAMGIIPAH